MNSTPSVVCQSSANIWVCHKMGLLIILIGLWLLSSVKADSKAITTSLTTKWFSTPLLLEAR
uniref:Uncharacterized protein n=1 Tax=Sus scrofa TaxID=9823 RepID=A0A8D0QEG6_PIG